MRPTSKVEPVINAVNLSITSSEDEDKIFAVEDPTTELILQATLKTKENPN